MNFLKKMTCQAEKEWIGIGQTEQELQTIADTDDGYLSQDGLALCINGCENDL